MTKKFSWSFKEHKKKTKAILEWYTSSDTHYTPNFWSTAIDTTSTSMNRVGIMTEGVINNLLLFTQWRTTIKFLQLHICSNWI